MLLGLASDVRILLAREPIDMRNSIDGLAATVRNGWQDDLYAGHLFVFVSRRGDRLKFLTWDAGGFVLTYKRLEKGRFRMPQLREGVLGAQLDATQLAFCWTASTSRTSVGQASGARPRPRQRRRTAAC